MLRSNTIIAVIFACILIGLSACVSSQSVGNAYDSGALTTFQKYFPAGLSADDFAAGNVMTEQAKAEEAARLKTALEGILDRLTEDEAQARVNFILQEEGFKPISPSSLENLVVKFIDDGQPHAYADEEGIIGVGSQMLRALMLGNMIGNEQGDGGIAAELFATMSDSDDDFFSNTPKSEIVALSLSRDELRSKLETQLADRLSLLLQADRNASTSILTVIGAMDAEDNDELTEGEKKFAQLMQNEMLAQELLLNFAQYKNSEFFVLAHEFAHLHLDHKSTTNCQEAQKQEDEADAFAAAMHVALLDYEAVEQLLGLAFFEQCSGLQALAEGCEINLLELAQAAVANKEELMPAGHKLVLRYGLSEAGITIDADSKVCGYRPVEERIAFIDEKYSEFMIARMYGALMILEYQTEHPSGSNPISISGYPKEYREAYLNELGIETCGDNNFKIRGGFGTYEVKCNAKVPTKEDFDEVALTMIGKDAWAAFVKEYK